MIALFLSACGLSQGSSVPAPANLSNGEWAFAPTPASHKRVKGKIRIVVPKHRHRVRIHGHYISAATQSIAIAVTPQGGGTTQNFNADLTTASNPNCTETLVSPLTCTITISLPAGSYTGTFTTYDGLLSGGNAPTNPPTGNELSADQNVPFTFNLGTANSVNVTLYGLPTAVTILPIDAELTGNAATGFTAYTTFTSTKVEVLGLDADKNVILGAGAPTPTLTSNNTPVVAVSTPAPSSPNTFTLSEPGVGTVSSTATLTATVTPIAGSGGTTQTVNSTVTLTQAPVIIQNGNFSTGSLSPWTACSFARPAYTAPTNAAPTPESVSTQYTSSPSPTWAPIPTATLSALAVVVTPPPNLNPSPNPLSQPTLAPPSSGEVAFTGSQSSETPGTAGICQQFTVSASQPYLSFYVYEAGNEYQFKYDDQEADILDSTGTTVQRLLFSELNCFDVPGTLGTYNPPGPSPTPYTNTGCEPNHTTFPSYNGVTFNGTSTFTDWQGGMWVPRGPYNLSAFAGQTITLFIGMFSDSTDAAGANGNKYWNGMFVGNVQMSATPTFPASIPGVRRAPHRAAGT